MKRGSKAWREQQIKDYAESLRNREIDRLYKDKSDLRNLLKPVLKELQSKGWLAVGLCEDCVSCSMSILEVLETKETVAQLFWTEQSAPEHWEKQRLAEEEIGDSKDDDVIRRAFERVWDIPDEDLGVTCDDIALRYNGNTISDKETGDIIKATCLAHNIAVEWDGDPRKIIIAKKGANNG